MCVGEGWGSLASFPLGGIRVFLCIFYRVSSSELFFFIMMSYCFHDKNPTLGKHSVTKFGVPNAGVHCKDGLNGNFCSRVFVQSRNIYDQLIQNR